MPILQAEADVFPEHLLAADPSPGEFDGHDWLVLHTLPRQEKSLARELYRRRVPFYLPLVARRNRIRGRILTSRVPLFTSYLFLLGRTEERDAALATGRVVRVLKAPDRGELWRDLRQVNRLLASGAPVTVEDRLTPGTPVEIQQGPLAGLKGTVVRGASGHRFFVAVDFIQRGASVLLDGCVLAPSE